MLKLHKITKDYVMKDLENVHALKGITVCFRRSEFVAILGPSGCGKTTLLNIIGGLDKYTSGNLLIEGRSTKNYDDRDWDTYRNHSVGFVFQSYNLISHQSILKNVELALTISGVSKKERKERATEALAMVGLAGSEKKKPNQLSGGQMQRVAIARALVNNPEILLADEPTGALDSETSIQIMDLLKKVAKDRLVIMVTHNPDLAEKYANRIITMKDGLLTGDSNLYKGETPSEREEVLKNKIVNKGSKTRTSMSFFTAMGLSLSNLISKAKRTVLVAIAGSIGIIGVSAVLAVSHGVNSYIDNMQDDMLSSYPIQIAEQSVDYTSLITSMNGWDDKRNVFDFDITTEVGLESLINYLMNAYADITKVKTNDISHDLIKYIKEMDQSFIHTTSFNYGIDPTNNLFVPWTKDYKNPHETDIISINGLTQRYISELKTVEGFAGYAQYVDLFTGFMKELPDNKDFILSQYDLLGDSKYAEEADEMMLVLESNSTMTDVLLAQLGFFDHDSFINIARKALEQNKEGYDDLSKEEKQAIDEKFSYPYKFEYKDLIGKELYYLPHDEIFSYGSITSESYEQVSCVILQDNNLFYLTYSEDIYNMGLEGMYGIYFNLTSSSSYKTVILMRDPSTPKEEGVKGKPSINGNWYILSDTVIDMIKGIPEYANQFKQFDITSLNLYDGDLTNINISNAETDAPSVTLLSNFFMPVAGATINVNSEIQEPVSGYQYKATLDDTLKSKAKKIKISGILRRKEGLNFGSLQRGFYYNSKFTELYMNDSKDSQIINDEIHGFKQFVGSPEEKTKSFAAYVTFDYLDYSNFKDPTDTDPGVPAVERNDGYAMCLNGDFSQSFSSLFSSFTGVDYFQTDKVYFRSLCGQKIIEETDDNEEVTYSFDALPQEIDIYPKSFALKDNVTKYLDKWNEDESKSELTYTDTIGMIITVVDTLINAITIALIAFTSLSLVVSCFMIAVITIISVMERIKEIGVIRSLGGRKKDVSRLFIAENIIIGLFAGLIGIGVTYIICIVINAIVAPLGVHNIASLTILTAAIMVALSTFLTTISGLIPSHSASKQDPVVALRTE